MTTVKEFAARLQRDVSGGDPAAVIGVYDLESAQWIVPADRDVPPDGFSGPGLVARIKGSDHVIEETGQAALLELANFAQDLVIDETGKSWPDVEHGGRIVHLEPMVHQGAVAWGHRNEPVCAIGEVGATT